MEVLQEDENFLPTRKWIRPISSRTGGEINSVESRLSNKPGPGHLSVLDVIDLHVQEPAAIPGQPEDWYIDPQKPWRYRGSVDRRAIEELVESPPHLWLESRWRADRVSPEYLQRHGLPSLYLIQASSLRIIIREISDPMTGRTVKKRRAQFRYRGFDYDLALTDPVIQSQFFPSFPNVQAGVVDPGPSESSLLCVSLAPEFNGYHYKLVASVIQ